MYLAALITVPCFDNSPTISMCCQQWVLSHSVWTMCGIVGVYGDGGASLHFLQGCTMLEGRSSVLGGCAGKSSLMSFVGTAHPR